MSYSPKLSTTFNRTKNRTANDVSDLSGMCAVCTEDCIGGCEIGLSAIRGEEATYPYKTNTQQFASEKKYPFDYSHFNINGRVFGAYGIDETNDFVNVYSADTTTQIGIEHPIKMKAPLILPAIAKLDWEDYYTGAAMFGIPAVIGESAVKLDKDRIMEHQKVMETNIFHRMEAAYHKYQDGYGDLILQVNADDRIGRPHLS